MGRPKKSAILVDGENMSRLDMLTFRNGYPKDTIRRFYTGDCYKKSVYENPWSQFEVVHVPRIGKEAVDMKIAMDMMGLYYRQMVREFVLASNDYDFGGAAVFLKQQHRDAKITIMRSSMSTNKEFLKKMKEFGIKCKPLFKEKEEKLAFKILSLLKEHIKGEYVPILKVAEILSDNGYPYPAKGYERMKKDLESLGFSIENGRLELSDDSSPSFS